jgi:hypothetical protein
MASDAAKVVPIIPTVKLRTNVKVFVKCDVVITYSFLYIISAGWKLSRFLKKLVGLDDKGSWQRELCGLTAMWSFSSPFELSRRQPSEPAAIST